MGGFTIVISWNPERMALAHAERTRHRVRGVMCPVCRILWARAVPAVDAVARLAGLDDDDRRMLLRRAVLGYVSASNARPPTVLEIARDLGFQDLEPLSRVLRDLEDVGFIERLPLGAEERVRLPA